MPAWEYGDLHLESGVTILAHCTSEEKLPLPSPQSWFDLPLFSLLIARGRENWVTKDLKLYSGSQCFCSGGSSRGPQGKRSFQKQAMGPQQLRARRKGRRLRQLIEHTPCSLVVHVLQVVRRGRRRSWFELQRGTHHQRIRCRRSGWPRVQNKFQKRSQVILKSTSNQ